MDKVLFRFDFNKSIGFGHLVRCNTLAGEFKNRKFKNIHLGSTEKNLFINYQKNFHKILNINVKNEKDEIEQIISVYKKNRCKLLVLDKFFKKRNYHFLFKKNNIKFIEFVPSKETKSFADYVICTIPYTNKEIKNSNTKKKDQKFYFGEKFTILREQFYKHKIVKTQKNIFLNLGGGNDKNGTIQILKTIYKHLDDFRIKLIIGNNLNYKKICLWIKKNDNLKKIELIKGTKNLVKHIDQSKFAICSAGQISHEINARAKKMILFSIVNNQILQAEKWQKKGHSYLGDILKIKKTELIKKLDIYKNKKDKKFKIKKKYYTEILNEVSK